MRARKASSTSGGALSKKSGFCAHRLDPIISSATVALDMAAVPIVQWLEVPSGFDWSWIILPGLACGSLLAWQLAPAARRRVRFVWALLATALLLRISGGLSAAPRWILEAQVAIEQLAVLHLIVI